jgi:hypothetical protein
MVDPSKCVFPSTNYKFISVSTCASIGASTLEDIKNLVSLMCFYWYLVENDIEHITNEIVKFVPTTFYEKIKIKNAHG